MPKYARFPYLVDVPFLTSHMEHLKASALFLKVQTEQSQKFPPSPASGECAAAAEDEDAAEEDGPAVDAEDAEEAPPTPPFRLRLRLKPRTD